MLRSVNPATGQEIATFPELTSAELDMKLAKASSVYASWRLTSLDERSGLLRALAASFATHKERLARMATAEMGKTYMSAIAEVEKCAAAFRHYAEHGPSMLTPRRTTLAAGGKVDLLWQPIGAVLAVMPWNFPYWQVARFLAPALLSGNVGLLKHASIVQGVAGFLEEMVVDAGGPDGLFQNLAVKSDAIAKIISDPRVAAVTLTGSEGAGMAVAAEAGRHLKKVVLELGGSDPFIVMPSAHLHDAVQQAVKARIQNTGQSCICAKRMIVHTDIYDAFLAAFSAAMAAVKAGDPLDQATDMGPLSSMAQRDTVLSQIKDAEKHGAKLLIGGVALPGPGAFISAGVLTDTPREGPFLREEIFGPIAVVCRAKDLDDAIRIANETPYGLGSSVWTTDLSEQQRFIRDLDVGMVALNQMLASSPDAPFGGVKRSGYGRELGPTGIYEFMNLKSVLFGV